MVRLHSLYLHFWSSGSSGSSSFTFWWKIYRNIWRAKAPRLYWMNTWCIWRLNAHNKDELVWCGSMSLSADSRLVLVRWPAWEPGRGMRGMSDLRLSYGRTLAHTQNLTFVLGHYFGHNTLAGRHSGRGFSLKVQDMPMLPSHTHRGMVIVQHKPSDVEKRDWITLLPKIVTFVSKWECFLTKEKA